MVTEVTERALAHTEKKEVLLTGGVAANKRLQSMLAIIAEEHDARFHVVPLEFATDNGAMIAWTGVLAYKHGLVTPIDESYVKLRMASRQGGCAMDNSNKTKRSSRKAQKPAFTLQSGTNRKVIIKTRVLQKNIVPPSWISRFEAYRTVHEPQLMHEAKAAGVPTPLIYMVNVPEAAIVMEYIEGQQIKQLLNKAPQEQRHELCIAIGTLIGKLHSHGLIHGDLTTSNMILSTLKAKSFLLTSV